ncbi:protein mono-ADP-ribosyltransferase PARP15-like [Xenia sp. Carnegie-2017]|uniref:protein mono-ADP-ribosyltransferase PARP15-like n=1 Tax=Xenia sp. Carnegie-2017 TaxID=2897299 RepID=UPI001F03C717|nr:protein mono-ADP-ribosyltransferase PARP15-like [Xenia sp. Carnegie-2017]
MSIKVCDDKEIYIVKGDITKETSDVIAHVTNPHLVMGSGVARALSKAGGREIERACELLLKRDAPLHFNTVLTTAGNLKANYIAHMVAGNSPSLNEIEKCLKDLFDTITKLELESVSLPAVGTGSLNCDPEKVASTLLKSIIRGQQSNPGSPNKVRIVLKEDELVEVFEKAVNGMSEFGDQSWWKRISNYLTGSSVPRINIKPKSPNNSRTLWLSIYAKDDECLRLTIAGIMDVIKSHKKRDKFEDENIKNLSSSQIKDLEDLFLAYNIEATIEEKLDRILMYGHADDILKVKSEIFKFFKELDQVEKEWKKDEFDHGLASIVSQCVQWYYVGPKTGALVEYDPRTNAIIEKAYSNQEKSVKFCLKEQDCEIDFHGMIEKNSSLKVPDLKVIRKELKAETALPDYWDPQPRDANGKEHVFHLVTLDQQNPRHQKEYNEVSADFLKTARHKIISIQRVQNPTLYKQYLLKKKSLDAKNGSCEKWLFHGTAGNNLQKINESGLNRSFSGYSHGAAHGRGVYFATDASMSAGYAQPYGSTGSRYMYRTKVAVGKFTLSNQSFVVPPDISPGNAYDSVVDNMANPKIYVLFYDNQYYPEYLITFT